MKNANAVVREDETIISIEAFDNMYVSKNQTITVLNEEGNNTLNTYLHYSNYEKITHLYCEILDAKGNRIQKFKASKFDDISAVDGGTLYSDSRIKKLDYTPVAYPYTVVFQSSYKTSSTGFIPTWYPIPSYNLAVQQSTYRIFNTGKLEIRTKEHLFENFSIIKENSDQLDYTLLNQPAIKYESLSPSYLDIMPYLMVSLNQFSLKGVNAYVKDWKSFGSWMNEKLLKDKITLDESTIAKAKSLVKYATTDIEKAKILYKYMQNKTRYISVQVGIGGWEPIPAKAVDKLGYGDCKGLTNYTKALFDAVGVKSNYTVVYAKHRRDIDSSFASIQGNHVILNVPHNGKDVWLECTSQSLPFGFLGDFTDNRNVLVVSEKGGEIKRTTAYKNQTNLQTTKAIITVNDKGDASGELERISEGIQYDGIYYVENLPIEDTKRYYIKEQWPYINNLGVESVQLHNDKDSIKFKETLKFTIGEFGQIKDNELVFKVNVFNRNNYIPRKYRNRQLPFEIERGYMDTAEFVIKIPEDYNIGLFSPKTEIKSKFGEYTANVKKLDDTTLVYKKSLLIKEGLYPKEEYLKYREFRRKIAKEENIYVVLKKL